MEMHAIKRWWPLIFLLCAIPSAAQDALRKRVSLPSTLISAGDLRKEVSRQTGLQFTFSSQTIRPGQVIRLSQRNLTAKALLDAMQLQLQAEYKVYEDHVIFTKKKQITASRDDGQLKNTAAGKIKPVVNSAGNHITRINTRSSDTQSAQNKIEGQDSHVNKNGLKDTGAGSLSTKTVPIATGSQTSTNPVSSEKKNSGTHIFPGDRLRSQATAVTDERLRARAYRLTLASPGKQAGITAASRQQPLQPQKDRFSGNTPIFTRYTTAGVEFNETFPANFLIKGGIPLLHGIVGWSAASRHSSWRFGGGTRWSLSETWHLQANFTTGKVKDSFQNDSLGMISRTVRITETLHRIGVYAERNFGKRWSAVAGVSWNMLSRTNTYNGNRVKPGDLIFSAPVPEEGYRALKPLYTISSSFNENSKTWNDRWIGIQAGAYYRF